MVEKQKRPKKSVEKKVAKVQVKAAPAVDLQKEQFKAVAKYIWISPYKLRLLANVVRGKNVIYALNWLTTYRTQRAVPIKKVIESAVANAKNKSNVEVGALTLKEIKIDQGPIHKYFKPGAMGRAMVQRKRLSHVSIILESNA